MFFGVLKKIVWHFLYAILAGFILLFFFLVSAKWYIHNSTKKQILTEIQKVPYHKVALVLGTSRYLRHHIPNPYFNYRIQAAHELYLAGKVHYILVSGDNTSPNYNEPKDMQHALMERGVPKENIIMDYAGIHTLDSVIRCKKVFGQDKCIIVSQGFHVARALFIANHSSMKCVGYAAQDVSLIRDYKTHLREYFACAKAVLDIYVFHTQPKYLGTSLPIDKPIQTEKGGY
ncbi:MAG: YdcF family protein [Bacteroidia bacterium]|nr:YdcF family protein [Bacteroidia bacterium]MDW8345719.1 ElyC/SanA/YdcF family protein [Bacteroidia bacterium]